MMRGEEVCFMTYLASGASTREQPDAVDVSRLLHCMASMNNSVVLWN